MCMRNSVIALNVFCFLSSLPSPALPSSHLPLLAHVQVDWKAKAKKLHYETILMLS